MWLWKKVINRKNKRDKTLQKREISSKEGEGCLDPRTITPKPAEEAGAGNLIIFPPEIIWEILSYCDTKDKKSMRCVSKWCFNVVSTASKELKSLFGTYTIKDINDNNYYEILEVLTETMKRSNGLEVKLNLQLFTYEISCIKMKEMLNRYKENIISLGIPLSNKNNYSEILLEPYLELTKIQRLAISFRNVDKSMNKNIIEAIFARYSDKLEHLGVKDLKLPNNTVLQLTPLSELKSLSLDYVDINIVHSFIDAVDNGSITHLSIRFCFIRDMGNLDNLTFPKLQYLKLRCMSGESALALIKCNKNTINTLILELIKFEHEPAHYVHREVFRHFDVGDVNIPNLHHLELLGDYKENVALSFINSNKDTITKLLLGGTDFRNASLPIVDVSRLKCLYLKYYKDKTSELKVIKAFGRNITELWMFDKRKNTCVRKSTKKLNNLKKKAIALQ